MIAAGTPSEVARDPASVTGPYLARARKLVMEYSRQQDIPYTEMNLARAHVHVAKYINQVGLKAKEPFVCPVMAAYR